MALTRNYGTASIEFDVPVDDDTVFAVNSVTKAFTGVAAMRLVEQGRLDLSAPVSRYLMDLPEAWRTVTIRQLLSHMSGLPDVMRAPTVETDAPAAWAWVQTQPIRFQPGERFNYCQTNYTLIQRVVNQSKAGPWTPRWPRSNSGSQACPAPITATPIRSSPIRLRPIAGRWRGR